MVRAQQQRHDGAILGLRHLALETGSPRLERYNGYSAVEIVGEAAPGISTGTAMDMMEKLAAQLPTGFGLEWTAMSYRNASLALRRRPCMRFLCWWCSCAGGAVRELVGAVLGDAGGAAGVIGALLATGCAVWRMTCTSVGLLT